MTVAFLVLAFFTLTSAFFAAGLAYWDATYKRESPGTFLPIGELTFVVMIACLLLLPFLVMLAITPGRILAYSITSISGVLAIICFLLVGSMGDRFTPGHMVLPSITTLGVTGLCLLVFAGKSSLWLRN